MIIYIHESNFEEVENFLLAHPDEEYKSKRFLYFFKQVGDCAGIFRRAIVNDNERGYTKGKEELISYYHEGEF